MPSLHGINNHSNTTNPPPPFAIYPSRDPHDALYELPEQKLREAIYIPATFAWGKDGRIPVLLVPGTGSYGGEAFEPNFAKLLTASSFGDPVWLNVPGRMNDISHRNAEYVAYAISYMSTMCARDIAVAAWSQGNMSTQWALKYWPSNRKTVSNFIALSPDFHGTITASSTVPLKVGFGNPSIWAQKRSSNFIATLLTNDGDSAYVPTTTIFSRYDEVVQPQHGAKASAFLKDVRGVGVTNVELQSVPGFKSKGKVYGHATVMANPLSWALCEDALMHGGPAQLERIDVAALSARDFAVGLTQKDRDDTSQVLIKCGVSIVAYPKKVIKEPKLPAFAT